MFQWKPFPLIIDFDRKVVVYHAFVVRMSKRHQEQVSVTRKGGEQIQEYSTHMEITHCWKKCRLYLPLLSALKKVLLSATRKPTRVWTTQFIYKGVWIVFEMIFRDSLLFTLRKLFHKTLLFACFPLASSKAFLHCSQRRRPFGQNISKKGLQQSPLSFLQCSLIHQVKFFRMIYDVFLLHHFSINISALDFFLAFTSYSWQLVTRRAFKLWLQR